jgi:hypothetical protein
MIHIVGWIVVAAVVVLMTINASFMLVSPRAWFRLPGWLRAQGTLTEERYTVGWGALQLRIAGALILASLGWVAYAMLH